MSTITIPDTHQFTPGESKPQEYYDGLVALSKATGIPVPMLNLKAEVTSPDGEKTVIYDGPSRTYNRNYWMLVLNMLCPTPTQATSNGVGDGSQWVRTSDGQSQNFYNQLNTRGMALSWSPTVATLTTVGYGIVVGLWGGEESFEHCRLGHQILHGTGTNQLSYALQYNAISTWDQNTNTWTVVSQRVFNNNSAATVTVKETGIRASIGYGTGDSGSILICRDKLSSPIDVLVGGQLTITYTQTLAMPTTYPTLLWDHVKLLMFNEQATNTSTTFVDQSNQNCTITIPVAGPVWSNTTTPVGLTSVINFPGTAGRLIATPAAPIDPGMDDWVIEFTLYPNITTASRIFETRHATGSETFGNIMIYRSATSNILLYMSSDGSSWNQCNAWQFAAPSNTTWSNIKLIKQGHKLIGFKDGVYYTSAVLSDVYPSYVRPITSFRFGDNGSGSDVFNGRIGSFRFTVGNKRIFSADVATTFTPQTLPYPLA